MESTYQLVPGALGAYWVEAEALLPDGRRIFGVDTFQTAPQVRLTFASPPRLNISGPVGGRFVLQSSPDLLAWGPVISATFDSSSYDFDLAERTDAGNRFFRVLLMP